MKLPSATLTRIYDLAMKSAGGLYTPHGDLSDVKRVVAQAFVATVVIASSACAFARTPPRTSSRGQRVRRGVGSARNGERALTLRA